MPDVAKSHPEPSIRVNGLAYRAVDPRAQDSPTSGAGAAKKGQRFNPVGMEALYLSLSAIGAIRDACKGIERIEPVTVVAVEVDVHPVADATDPVARRALGIGEGDFDEAHEGAEKPGPGQRLAKRLKDMGFAGMRVASFAPGAGPDEINLVLWTWGDKDPTEVRLIDNEGRLNR